MNSIASEPRNTETLMDLDLTFIDLLPVACYICEAPSGTIKHFNTMAAELWGRTPGLEEPAEKYCGAYRLFHLDGSPCPRSDIPMIEVLQKGATIRNAELIMERPDGSRIFVMFNINPILNRHRHVIGAINTFVDVTASRQAEAHSLQLLEIMHAERERLIGFFEHSPAFMAVLRSSEHIYEKANERYLDMIGQRDIIGKRLEDVSPELAGQGFVEKLDRVYSSGRTFIGNEVTISLRSSNGETIKKTLDLVYEPLLATDGSPSGVLVHGIDLTEHKKLELELQKRAEELAVSDRQKDEFIALLAHELRNPLAPIRNGLQVMSLVSDKPELLEKVRDMMGRQLNHMVRLIDDLLDVSRMNRNKLYLKKSWVSLNDAINHALEATRPALELAGHELFVQFAPDDVLLEADLTRLAQVFGNLLSNSIKYTEPGGQIWFAAEVKGNEVVVSVRDTGIGFPAHAAPNLFQMFSQVHSSDRTNAGLGIGLALVRTLVEMHGGRVTAQSDGPGRGSRFSVHLPLPSQFQETEIQGNYSEPLATIPEAKILVVDDNRDACTSMAMLLDIMGHSVKTAYDGLSAVQLAEEFRPQLILMDIGMPLLNGYEATQRIRQQAWSHNTLIVALTGWGQEHDRNRSQAAGCDGHLVKPVSREDLESILARLRPAKPT